MQLHNVIYAMTTLSVRSSVAQLVVDLLYNNDSASDPY